MTIKIFFKKIYEKIPLKKQLFTILRIFPLPHMIFKHLHFKSTIKIKVNNKISFLMYHYGYQLENAIFWRGISGGWEKVSIDLWIKLSKISNVILDIGANTGVYALTSQALNPNAKVYAFEPVNRVFEKLKNNIIINKFPIKCLDSAVSDKDGNAVIYDEGGEHIYSVTVNLNLSGTQAKEVKIKTLKLSSLIKKEKIKNIDLIKIDVETHEAEVLKGMDEYLNIYKPTLLIEILNDDVAKNVQYYLDGKGYLYFDIDEKSPPKLRKSLQKSSYYNYLICQPNIAKTLNLI